MTETHARAATPAASRAAPSGSAGLVDAPGAASAPSVAELVDSLRRAMMSGDLVPNQRLVEADLAGQYGASRGTVRQALAELSVEGLVERVQNRGARVRAISVDEAVEITEVRAAVESLCARKAAQRIDEEGVSELRALGEAMRRAVSEGDRETYAEANRTLHARIIEISGQRTAARTIRRLRGQAVRFQFKLSRQAGRPTVSLPQHLAIIETVCAHDADAAAAAMNAHLTSVIAAIRSTAD